MTPVPVISPERPYGNHDSLQRLARLLGSLEPLNPVYEHRCQAAIDEAVAITQRTAAEMLVQASRTKEVQD